MASTAKKLAPSDHNSDSHASANHRALLLIIVLALAVIPLSLWAVTQPVSYIPKAASPSGSTALNSHDHTPRLTSPLLTRSIKCQVGQVCEHVFTVTDTDSEAALSLEINFLPPALQANTCEQVSLPSKTTLTCSFSGIPERAGEFKLLLVATDDTGDQENTMLTLNIDD